MGKSKKGVSHAGPHKKHGPKRKMFHDWDSTTRLAFGKLGILNKYHNLDSFILSCQARGLKHGTQMDWQMRFSEFRELKTHKEKVEWLNSCKNYKDPDPNKKKTISVKA